MILFQLRSARLLGLMLSVVAMAGATVSPAADAGGESAWTAHGFSAAQRTRLRDVWRWGIDRGYVPGGAMLIVHRGEVVFREAFGVADLATGRPFGVDAPCRLASVTKPFTATLFAMLVERGRFGWDDPIDRFLPEFKAVQVRGRGPARRAPLVRELLAHTAGFMGNRERGEELGEFGQANTLTEVVGLLARRGLENEPGTAYAYSGFGYMVAGRVAEAATGRDFPALMRDLVLRPAGVEGAVFLPDVTSALRARMPTMYDRSSGWLVPAQDVGRTSFPNPGGGLVASLDDVGRLLLLHRNRGRIDGAPHVAAESLQALYRPQPPARRERYGFGFNILRLGPDGAGDRVRHTGASGTLALIDFRLDLLVVVLTQVPTKQRPEFGDRLNQAIDAVFSTH